jgi:tryptophanyl-tRNA synthetase
MKLISADTAEIDRVLGNGADRAAAIAAPILAETYEKVGLLRSRQI